MLSKWLYARLETMKDEPQIYYPLPLEYVLGRELVTLTYGGFIKMKLIKMLTGEAYECSITPEGRNALQYPTGEPTGSARENAEKRQY